MPFEIRTQDGQFCVFTEGAGGKNHGCHPTREAADKQLRALYANVPEASHSGASADASTFSAWTTEQRKAYHTEHPDNFAGPDMTFPIKTANDVKDAWKLAGHASNPDAVRSKIRSIAKRLGLSSALPDTAKESSMALFGEGDGFTIHADRTLFIAGDYPDKDFDLSPEEMLAAEGDEPVPLEIEHTSSVLDGKLGFATNRRIVLEDGRHVLKGDVSLPKWLDGVLPAGKTNLSCVWDKSTKALQRVGIVQNPRIPEAVLMAAFTASFEGKRHDTPEGQSFLQRVHDDAARAGAKCDRSNAVRMHSGHELDAIQAIHDAASEHGANCRTMGNRGAGGYPLAMYSGAGTNASGSQPGKDKNMTVWEKMKALFSGASTEEQAKAALAAAGVPVDADVGDGAGGAGTPTPAALSPSESAAFAAMKAQNDRLSAQVSELRQARVAAEGAAFCGTINNRITPHERAGVMAEYIQAAADDEALSTPVTFAREGQTVKGSRVDAMKARYLARKPHSYLEERIFTAGDVVFPPADSEKSPDEVAFDKYLAGLRGPKPDAAQTMAAAFAAVAEAAKANGGSANGGKS